MARYAEGTTVPVESSKRETERIIHKYGGDMVSIGWKSESTEIVGFRFRDRFIRMEIALPTDEEAQSSMKRDYGSQTSRRKWIERERMRRWRVLVLRLKTKLEMVNTGEASLDEEFGWHLALADGHTSGEYFSYMLEKGMPGTLPALAAGEQNANDRR